MNLRRVNPGTALLMDHAIYGPEDDESAKPSFLSMWPLFTSKGLDMLADTYTSCSSILNELNRFNRYADDSDSYNLDISAILDNIVESEKQKDLFHMKRSIFVLKKLKFMGYSSIFMDALSYGYLSLVPIRQTSVAELNLTTEALFQNLGEKNLNRYFRRDAAEDFASNVEHFEYEVNNINHRVYTTKASHLNGYMTQDFQVFVFQKSHEEYSGPFNQVLFHIGNVSDEVVDVMSCVSSENVRKLIEVFAS